MTLLILPRDGRLYDDITKAETNNLKKSKAHGIVHGLHHNL